jgi:hypothetical protein
MLRKEGPVGCFFRYFVHKDKGLTQHAPRYEDLGKACCRDYCSSSSSSVEEFQCVSEEESFLDGVEGLGRSYLEIETLCEGTRHNETN